jgi:glycosyltransferase involved in cell wall biosynthesis
MSAPIGVVVLTFNSAAVIERTIAAAKRVSPYVVCVDSGSTDGTIAILEALRCEVHHREFRHYADQRNWAIQMIGTRFVWQLHLDADEVLDNMAIAAIRSALAEPRDRVGFLLRRRTYFLGRALRFGGASSWHLRLFRSGAGACEDRLYDQHFICHGPTGRLGGWMHDMNVGSLGEWTARHNRWSDLEVGELLRPVAPGGHLEGRLGGDPRQRRRAYKGLYYQSPQYLRALAYFGFRYLLQLGFLDGRAGLLYAFLQALWFRMLVDAKLAEARSHKQQQLPSAAVMQPADVERSEADAKSCEPSAR